MNSHSFRKCQRNSLFYSNDAPDTLGLVSTLWSHHHTTGVSGPSETFKILAFSSLYAPLQYLLKYLFANGYEKSQVFTGFNSTQSFPISRHQAELEMTWAITEFPFCC